MIVKLAIAGTLHRLVPAPNFRRDSDPPRTLLSRREAQVIFDHELVGEQSTIQTVHSTRSAFSDSNCFEADDSLD